MDRKPELASVDNTAVMEKLLEGTPEEFKEAAAFLFTAIPQGLEVTDAKFTANQVMKKGQAPFIFEFLVRNPQAKRSHLKQFNAKKILRQIQKEKKYGNIQRSNFTI